MTASHRNSNTRRLTRPPDAIGDELLAEAVGALAQYIKSCNLIGFNINYNTLSLMKVVVFMLWDSRGFMKCRDR